MPNLRQNRAAGAEIGKNSLQIPASREFWARDRFVKTAPSAMESVSTVGFSGVRFRIAARFVSGYLNLDDDDDRVIGGNTHAWVQVYVPGPGWVDFDPSSGMVGNQKIRYAHKLAGCDDPLTSSEVVKATVHGIRRTVGSAPVRKTPATADKVVAMAALAHADMKGLRDHAILLLGFAGAFRRSELVAQSGLPLPLVRQQILDAVLLPAFSEEAGAKPPSAFKDDPAHERAAVHRNSPYQLRAGPGTGKTRSLVRRIESLLAENVQPAAILVLTFSNRTAGEHH